MKENFSNYIVKGYHANTPVSEKAKNEGLGFRFALVFDSYNPDVGYMYFQDAFFMSCLVEIANMIPHDTITINIDNKVYQSLEELSQHLLTTIEEDRQPPESILFIKNEQLICLEETEFWVLCGGDAPYSDSYTASFYTNEDMAKEFEKALEKASSIEGNRIQEIIQASVYPVKQKFWKKILKWI